MQHRDQQQGAGRHLQTDVHMQPKLYLLTAIVLSPTCVATTDHYMH